MAGKEISLTGELHMSSTGSHMTVDAVEALKVIGLAYGLYDHAEKFRGLRVSLSRISACMGALAGRRSGR